MSTEHQDLLLHKGKALERFCDLREAECCIFWRKSHLITDVMTALIVRLEENFAGRLDGLALPYQNLIAGNKTSSQLTQKANFILEPFDTQSSVTMARELCTNKPAKF